MSTLKYNAFKQDVRTRYDCSDGLPSCNILSAAFDKEGRAWVGTECGAAYFENGRFVPVSLFDGAVQVMHTDRQGNLWLACDNVICTCDKEYTQELDSRIISVSQDENGRLCLITEKFLYKFENGSFEKWYWTENATVLDMCAFGKGEIFVAAGDSIKTALGKRLRWFNVTPQTSKFPDSRIQAVAGDKFGITWVGTNKGLVIYDGRNHYVTKKKLGALTSYNVKKILFGKSGKRYVGTDIGLVVYDGAKRHFYGAEYWLPDGEVTAIAESNDGNTVWVGTKKGAVCIQTLRMTLSEKADFYADITEKYSVRDIGFVAMRVLENDRDLSSGHVCLTDNDGLRTGAYLMALSYQYAVTHDEKVLENARRCVKAMLFLINVTGVPGLIARCVRRKGDTSYGGDMKKWFDAGEYEWLGDVSSDEVVGHFSALSVFYDLCADENEKEQICKALCAVVDHILENDYKLCDADGEFTRWGNWNPDDINRNEFWSGEHGTNALEMLSFLKTAYHMSGDKKYDEEYIKLIKEEHYAVNTMYRKVKDAHTVHIDDNLCFLVSIPLLSYETDPDLRLAYLIGMREHWEYERIERNPFINIIYAALTGEHGDVDLALNSLREMPLLYICTTVKNSLRNDLQWDHSPEEFGEPPQLIEPLPYDEKPVVRYNRNHFHPDSECKKPALLEGANFLLPYWLGRYYGVIGE